MADRPSDQKKNTNNEWVKERKKTLNQSYLPENCTPESSVQASDALFRDDTFITIKDITSSKKQKKMLLSETVKTVMTYQYQQHNLGVEKKQ